MGANSKIEWTDHTFNPWIGCTKVAAGCTHCYAEALAKRTGLAKWGSQGTRVKTSEAYWRQPRKWDRAAAKAGVRARVFCASLADVFEDWIEPIVNGRGERLLHCDTCGAMRADDDPAASESCECGRFLPRTEWATMADLRGLLFALIDATPHLDWLLLTKRPENVRRMLGQCGTPHSALRTPRFPNVWLGTSVATQDDADANVPALLDCRDLAPVLFLSAEPLLGPIDLSAWLQFQGPSWRYADGDDSSGRPGLDWLIVGGESGPGARPMHPDWAGSLRDQCQAAGVPFFFKQWGEWGLLSAERGARSAEQRIVLADGEVYPVAQAEIVAELRKRRSVYDDAYWRRQHPQCVYCVGKKAAGRLLDGRKWNEFPRVEQPT